MVFQICPKCLKNNSGFLLKEVFNYLLRDYKVHLCFYPQPSDPVKSFTAPRASSEILESGSTMKAL